MIEAYSELKHRNLIRDWFRKRGLDVPNLEMVSNVGFCVDDAAIGFLFLTNSPIAYIDCIISNPEKHAEERAKAVMDLLITLEDKARHAGVKVLRVLGNLDIMNKRYRERGFMSEESFDLFFKYLGGI